MSRKQIEREMDKQGYSEHVVLEVMRWYNPRKQNRTGPQKENRGMVETAPVKV